MSNGIPSRYIPTGKILHGGMGEVLVCEDTNLERQVVIKFIQDVKDQRRLFDEITALQNIRSKHVVQIFDIFLNEIDRRIGIVQEYVPGSDLVNCMENSISEPEYLKILYQIICGICDIHAQGLIHRDIKPNNMKFDQSNIIKIFDFGLARFSGKNDSTLGFTGTPGFSAPELYRSGITPFTNTVDVYAFGVTAWYLSGTKLPDDLLRRPPNLKNRPSFSSLSLQIPSKILEILDRSLSENVLERPSASEIKELIGNYLLFGKHRGLIVAGDQQYILENINQTAKLDFDNVSLHIKYDGLQFVVDFAKGAVYINNTPVESGNYLPQNCVITLGSSSDNSEIRRFITFDISNPEVVL